MTDSSEIDERVSALLGLLKKKDFKKVKEVGEAIADAASDDEPWFEPKQVVDMMNIWLDACIAKQDLEALDVTAKCLRWAKVEDDSPHPGFPAVLKKVAKALDTPGAEHLGLMLQMRVISVKVIGEDNAIYPAVGELVKHPQIMKIEDAIKFFGSKFAMIYDQPDDEVTECMKLTVDLIKFITPVVTAHKPGEMEASKRLACQLEVVSGFVSSAMTFCSMCMVNSGKNPKAEKAIAAPASIMALQNALEGCKPKPKEQDLKAQIHAVSEYLTQLMQYLPKGSGGDSGDPVGDANTLVKGLKDAKDSGTLVGILNSMMGTTNPKALGIVLGKPAIEAVIKAFEKVKPNESDRAWQTLPQFLAWAADNQKGCLEPHGDKLADLVTSGPVIMVQPKALLDTVTVESPTLAKKIWAKVSVWQKAAEKSKGSAMGDGVAFQVVYALQSMPRALQGAELEDYCHKMMELVTKNKGGATEDAIKCQAIAGLTAVVSKDKTKIPKDVLDWIQTVKAGDGYAKNAATQFMDAYEGRSLEGAYTQIKEANDRFAKACGDMEGLKAYVDQNVSELKDFVGSVVKKLPVPCQFSSEPRYVVKMAMLLHFECQAEPRSRLCALPAGKTFTTETLEWNRWLKIGLSAAKVGKAIFSGDVIADIPGTVDQVKAIYSAYSKKDDKAFLTYISEPFLTSDEQDQLIGQLRKSGFFSKFSYDNQTAKWCCANCHLCYQRAGVRTPSALEDAATAIEGEDAVPLKEGDMERTVGVSEMAKEYASAAGEVKTTGAACFDLFGLCSGKSSGTEEEVIR